MALTLSMQVVSWGGNNINDGTNYSAHLMTPDALPPVQANMVERFGRWPLLGGVGRPGWKIPLRIIIIKEDLKTYQKQLHQWFDPEDETVKQLVVEDTDGTDDRYWEAICTQLQKDPAGPGNVYVATLSIHGDVRLRSSSLVTPSNWSITASGQTNAYTVAGEDDVYPKITITPTSAKTGGYSYKRWVPVLWRVSSSYSKYPVDICNDSFDTATLVSGGKMQADGDDLRVLVDGAEVDRWLDGINTATTKVWVNLDFQAYQYSTLNGALGTGDTTITVNFGIAGFPSNGILYVDSEAIVYTGKNNSSQQFTGCTRGAKGTTAATHTSGTAIYWIQHDIWILYGNASATAPTVDGDYEPAFELDHSTNTSWVYEEFGEDDGLRPGQWTNAVITGTNYYFYGGNQYTDADPWAELGIKTGHTSVPSAAKRTVFNPCEITAANFTNGEKWAYDYTSGSFNAAIWSSVTGSTFYEEYAIPAPSAGGWQAWSQNITSFTLSSTKYVVLYLLTNGLGQSNRVECSDVTLTLDSSNTPTITIGAEQGNYSLACRITNNTTGDAIDVDYTMALNEDLEIDTYEKTVTDKEDESNQFQALALVGGTRRDWLKLQPGSNTLQFDDTGTNAVTVAVSYRNRYYG